MSWKEPYYILRHFGGRVTALSLEAYTLAGALKALRHQQRGGFDTRLLTVCTYKAEGGGLFIGPDGRLFCYVGDLDTFPFTQEAMKAFKAGLKEA